MVRCAIGFGHLCLKHAHRRCVATTGRRSLAATWFFFSHRLSAAEVNYSTFDRELLAAHQAINHFLPQVEGQAFQLWTDEKPLVAAMTRVTPPASGRQQCHLAFISEHTCDVRHTPGMMAVADTLSRPPIPSRLFPSGTGCERGAIECLNCQKGKVHHPVRLRPHHLAVLAQRFSHIHVDLVGPPPRAPPTCSRSLTGTLGGFKSSHCLTFLQNLLLLL
jgi:hypothetical protein